LERRQASIHPNQAKARKGIAVPLNNTQAVVLSRKQLGKHPTHAGQKRDVNALRCLARPVG
jgi:hypothetical protein